METELILPGTPDAPDVMWHVLYVRPRCEKKMAAYCAGHNVAYYLALREETKLYQRRKVTVQKPVFPGYVFVVYGREHRVLVLKSNLIVRVLEVEHQVQLLYELEQIRKALNVDPTLGACEAFRSGRRVRVKGGPFQGVEGVVATRHGQARVLLNVEMIGQAVSLEVDMNLLESAE